MKNHEKLVHLKFEKNNTQGKKTTIITAAGVAAAAAATATNVKCIENTLLYSMSVTKQSEFDAKLI